ncbi:hypothetical protein CYMTET_21698, partial [Cymbomonas tetramitiformis]
AQSLDEGVADVVPENELEIEPSGTSMSDTESKNNSPKNAGSSSEGLSTRPDEDDAHSRLQRVPTVQVQKVRELGRGTYATVWLGKWRGAPVAIKEMHSSNFEGEQGEQQLADFYREQCVLASMAHPNVVGFYGVVEGEKGLSTVTEYVKGGSLKSCLSKLKKRCVDNAARFGNATRVKLAADAARGLEYLHWRRVIHFDVKGDNILADVRDLRNPVGKVGDLGLAKLKHSTFVSGNMRGTLPWMAPELFPTLPGSAGDPLKSSSCYQADRVTEKIDVYSFGVLLWEIWTWGEVPYKGMEMTAIFFGMMHNSLRPAKPVTPAPAEGWQELMEAKARCRNSSPTARRELHSSFHRYLRCSDP